MSKYGTYTKTKKGGCYYLPKIQIYLGVLCFSMLNLKTYNKFEPI